MTALDASLEIRELTGLAARQLNFMFPDGSEVESSSLSSAADGALARLSFCFAQIDNKYFSSDDGVARFDHLHGDQYAMWLYFLANELHRQGGSPATCAKLFLLNKALHGCDIYYEVELPRIFLLVHPLGTVLGRASYQDYLVVYQRVGVGSNRDIYPSFGRHVTLRPGSSVLGNCRIGAHCQIGAESLIIDRDLPDGSLYLGRPGAASLRPQTTSYPLWRV